MDINYYKQQVPHLAELTEKSALKQQSFFQSLLIVSVTLLGIVISLHDNTSDILLLRLVFAFAVSSLSLGILSIAVVLYDWSKMVERARQKFVAEVQSALGEDRQIQPVYESRRKISVVCEKLTYILLIASLLLLTLYAVVGTFS